MKRNRPVAQPQPDVEPDPRTAAHDPARVPQRPARRGSPRGQRRPGRRARSRRRCRCRCRARSARRCAPPRAACRSRCRPGRPPCSRRTSSRRTTSSISSSMSAAALGRQRSDEPSPLVQHEGVAGRIGDRHLASRRPHRRRGRRRATTVPATWSRSATSACPGGSAAAPSATAPRAHRPRCWCPAAGCSDQTWRSLSSTSYVVSVSTERGQADPVVVHDHLLRRVSRRRDRCRRSPAQSIFILRVDPLAAPAGGAPRLRGLGAPWLAARFRRWRLSSRTSRIIWSIARAATSSISASVTSSGCGRSRLVRRRARGRRGHRSPGSPRGRSPRPRPSDSSRSAAACVRSQAEALAFLGHEHLVAEVLADPAVPDGAVRSGSGQVRLDPAQQRGLGARPATRWRS